MKAKNFLSTLRGRNGKKIATGAVAGVLAAAIPVGILLGIRGKGQPVEVYAFRDIGMTEYWGDTQESYGPVTTDRIQTIFLSETQTVTAIPVAEGDEVRKGDILMSFDSTLSELELERKRLEVEKVKIELSDAKAQLEQIRNMKPMKIPTVTPAPEPEKDLGRRLTDDYRIEEDTRDDVENQDRHDGTTPEKAVICWMKGSYYSSQHINQALLRAIREQVRLLRIRWQTEEPDETPGETTEETTVETTEETTEEPTRETIEETTEETEEETLPKPAPETTPETIPTTVPETVPETTEETVPETTEESKPEPTTVATVPATPPATQETPPQTEATQQEDEEEQAQMNAFFGILKAFGLDQSSASQTSGGGSAEQKQILVRSAYVVFKVTEDDRLRGDPLLWQGLKILYSDGGAITFSFFDAYGCEDYTLGQTESPAVMPSPDFGGAYTAAELAKMRAEQEKKIKEIDLKLKMSQAEYKLMQREVEDGNIYADFDGRVISVLTEEEARQDKVPIVKLSGGGGFYIQGSVSELERDSLQPGQEVTVQDWQTGGTYTGVIRTVQDLPTDSDGWNGMGNPNASYYPFTVFVDGDADLQEGRYVSVSYSSGSGQRGVYLENPFLRTEEGRSFVYLRGADGRLHKRYVTVGKSLWGSYTEILDGLTAEDWIAFPYGKRVKAGAPTVEGDLSTLYSY